MSLISAQLMLLLLAILAVFTVASPVELDKREVDGYFTMCMRPNFTTEWHGPDWACVAEAEWVSGECYETPASLYGYVKSATPITASEATCHMYREHGCKGDSTPDIKFPGLPDFDAVGYHGDTLSWKCDCDAVCGPLGWPSQTTTLTYTPDPDATWGPVITAPPPPDQAREVAVTTTPEVVERVTDGYFTMCMRPDFSTEYHGGGWPCQYRVPWVSGQCYATSNDPADPNSLQAWVQSAKPEDDYGSTCHMWSELDCKGVRTPDIKAPGLNNFVAAGYTNSTFSWKCDCGATCIDADATVTATFDPNVTNSPLAIAPPPPTQT